jgi:phenylalanyl-tRNA synthetase beta subunit
MEGFDEIKTYIFQEKGDVEVRNPLASDKKALRFDLTLGMHGALEKNKTKVDLFGVDRLQLFEVGKRFRGTKEQYTLCLGVLNSSKSVRKKFGFPKDQLEKMVAHLTKTLDVSNLEIEWTDDTCEIHLTEEVLLAASKLGSVRSESLAYGAFKGFSVYQHSSRDISLWADSSVGREEVKGYIAENAGPLARRIDCFDVFEKDGKTSYAFRVVFQAQDRTLTDSEIDPIMAQVYEALSKKGLETR